MMLPTGAGKNNWNAETKGDIIEAFLGVAYLEGLSAIAPERWTAVSRSDSMMRV